MDCIHSFPSTRSPMGLYRETGSLRKKLRLNTFIRLRNYLIKLESLKQEEIPKLNTEKKVVEGCSRKEAICTPSREASGETRLTSVLVVESLDRQEVNIST